MPDTSMSQRMMLPLAVFILLASAAITSAQIPGQFAQDFVAGRVPSEEEIAKLEQDVTAHPDDFRVVRKLGKGYFFQFFGEGRTSSMAKSRKMLQRALELKKDDAETTAYLGALAALVAQRAKDPAEKEASARRAFDLLKKAQELEPNNGAVLAVTGASFLSLPDSFGGAQLTVDTLEKFRRMMGPMFARQSHHGQQRILLTLGQAYGKLGQTGKARALFEEGLKADQDSVEAAMLKAELGKLRAQP